jgi:hypothetical protein
MNLQGAVNMCAVVTSVLTPGNIVRPEIEPKHATSLTGNIFGLRVLHIIELNSYDDRNFHVRVSENSENENISKISPDGYVLKVLNSLDSEYENAIGEWILKKNQTIRNKVITDLAVDIHRYLWKGSPLVPLILYHHRVSQYIFLIYCFILFFSFD